MSTVHSVISASVGLVLESELPKAIHQLVDQFVLHCKELKSM